jgi:hypothetical protein
MSYGHQDFGGGRVSGVANRYRTDWHGSGLQGELTAGYELARVTSLRVFIQADAILPFYQVHSDTYVVSRSSYVTTTDRRYAPTLVVSIGLGR